ncbi:preprotein translocase subunit SecD [Leucobacter soli]|uniref:preprotein translocase subunit SecD n=1 Tax=Leucobacter soli TaxID=2812850 RepID=UPI003617EF10
MSIPGKADEATLQRIEASAQLDFRPVLAAADGTPTTDASTETDADGDDAAGDGTVAEDSAAEDPAAEDSGAEDAAAEDATDTDAATDTGARDPDPIPETAYDEAWLTDALVEEFNAFECTPESTAGLSEAPGDRPLITCENDLPIKYILGPVELSGDVIEDATAQLETTSTGATTGQWAVQMKMNDEGTQTFGEISQRMYGAQSPLDQFAFVLDGQVLSAPTMNAQILNGRPSITGNFTQDSAEALADQLKFGALPIGFTVQSQEDISATLGSNQLQAGLLAGLIGLLLVVVYSMFQYRALGSITILSSRSPAC